MANNAIPEATRDIIRRRMHGLYLSRQCSSITELSRELLGLHSWFYRNVPFSALIRGADISGYRTSLTKTWLYRGTLHGVVFDELPQLLAIGAGNYPDGDSWLVRLYGEKAISEIAAKVIDLMEDGVYARGEMRGIFAGEYGIDGKMLSDIFSPWGGVFVYLARRGKVAFRDMASRDFDLIDAQPSMGAKEAFEVLGPRYFAAYGPACMEDAIWFFGLNKEDAKWARNRTLDGVSTFVHEKKTYCFVDRGEDVAEIPHLTLLSGFDPILASYVAGNRLSLPDEYKARVVLKSGICQPTIAIDGMVAGLWNIRKNEPVVEFFQAQPKRVESAAMEAVERIILETSMESKSGRGISRKASPARGRGDWLV